MSKWPLPVWDLKTLTLAAFYYHPDMALARAQGKTAKAGILSAKQSPNPTLSFTPEKITNPSPGLSPWIQTFNLNFPIETGGKKHFRVEQAKLLTQSSLYAIETTAWAVRMRLAGAFLNLYTQTQKETYLRHQDTNLSSHASLIKQQTNNGQISPRQLTDIQLLLDQVKIQLTQTQMEKHLALADLAAAIGIPVSNLEKTNFNFAVFKQIPSLKKINFKNIQMQALTNRPDILGGVTDYAASQAALQQELAKRYPDINLGPGYQWSQGENHWSLGFSLTLPLLNFNKGPIAEARARCEETLAKFDQLQASVIADLDHAWINFRDALKNLDVAQTQFAHQKEKWSQLKGGPLESMQNSLMTAQMNLDATKLFLLNSFDLAQKAWLDLENVMQKPLGE